MVKILKYLIFILIIIGLVSFAWFLGYKYSFTQKKVDITQEAILQQVKNVIKLGTVEGYFSEVFDYKEYRGFDFSPFRKKALIRTKAKVLAGFNLENINIKITQKDKTVIISNIPQPQILSIDHDLDYYDITEGTFNSFTTEDYNKMNSQSKLFIEKTALSSNILNRANEQLNEHLQLLNSLLNSYGWKLIYKPIEEHKEKLLD